MDAGLMEHHTFLDHILINILLDLKSCTEVVRGNLTAPTSFHLFLGSTV